MPLETILSTEGMISLKWSVLENIETRHDTATEREVLDSIKEDLVEQVCYLVCGSSKQCAAC